MRILGAVLAGGKSTRFGSDKAEALLNGKRLIDHAADALRAHCADVIVVGRQDTAHTCTPDAPGPDLGPLGGLCGALGYAAAHGYDAVLSTGCDVPDIPGALVRTLQQYCPSACEAQPIIGYWSPALASDLTNHLAMSDNLSMMRWIETSGARLIRTTAPLRNINRPGDLG